jgi:dCMP deaminase
VETVEEVEDALTWDSRWMDLAFFVSNWSKDRSRKTGAVIVDRRNVLLSIGWNGFPRGVDDDVHLRHERPAKYQWTEHAERNAIYNAAAKGIPTLGCVMHSAWYPCADCARAVIQAGIVELVSVEPDWNDKRWASDFVMVRKMLGEAGVNSRFLAGYEPPVS